LADGTLDTTTSLGLVGRNYVGYGETQNENFVFLLENFANDSPPSRPLVGQIWFSTTDDTAYAYDGTQWNPIGSATLSSSAPLNTNSGALWLKTPINQLYIYTGTEWRFIGPEAVEGFGSTRARAGSLDNTAGNPQPVIFLETNGTVFAICTAATFVINPNNSVAGFSNTLQVGINLSTTAKINGSITGNAVTADQLSTARLINGVPFTASSDITITANTTNLLKKGDYIVGADFNGAVERTWNVDASSANLIGKIVARNAQGGFSAGTVTADFVGDLTGNVTATSGTSTFNTVQAAQFIGAQLSGNSATATRLATVRTINGVGFDGSNNITVTASAGTLTGNSLNNSVTLSSLTQVGTLTTLTVNDSGIFIGSGSQLRLSVDSSIPTIRSVTGRLNFDMGLTGPDINFVDSATSLSLGGPSSPALIGDNTTNLGIPGYKFGNIYADNFFGNADSATLALRATNIVGGGLGAIPVQTSSSNTGFLGLGADNYVLRARPSGPAWEPLTLEQLNKGSFINMANSTTSGSVNLFNSSVPVTISVDATSSNTASKVVARDASGNFSAGTITANLVGTVTGNLIGNATTATNAVNATNAVTATTATTATNAATATNPQAGGSFITSSNIASQSVAFATNSNAAVNAVTSASCTGNAATATNPQAGGSFITSSNIASQSVAFATNANAAVNATTANSANSVAWNNISSKPTLATFVGSYTTGYLGDGANGNYTYDIPYASAGLSSGLTAPMVKVSSSSWVYYAPGGYACAVSLVSVGWHIPNSLTGPTNLRIVMNINGSGQTWPYNFTFSIYT